MTIIYCNLYKLLRLCYIYFQLPPYLASFTGAGSYINMSLPTEKQYNFLRLIFGFRTFAAPTDLAEIELGSGATIQVIAYVVIHVAPSFGVTQHVHRWSRTFASFMYIYLACSVLPNFKHRKTFTVIVFFQYSKYLCNRQMVVGFFRLLKTFLQP